MNDILAKKILIRKKVDKRLLISSKLLVDQWHALVGMAALVDRELWQGI